MNKVSIVKCQNYEYDEVKKVLIDSFNNIGGIDKLVKKGMNIALKPNLVMALPPSKAATTHPVLIHALTDLLIDQGAVVSIVESPGGPYIKASLKGVYKTCGLQDLTNKTKLTLNYDLDVEVVKIKDGLLLKKIEILKPLIDADLIINLPKLKSHGQMSYTGAVKNMFGAVPGAKKAEYHMRMAQYDHFANAMIDIFLSTKPKLSIMDAVVGMEGNGPSAGNPRKIGFIGVSENAFDLDYACLHLVGVKPESIPIIEQGIKRELCASSIDQIELCGSDLKDIKKITDFDIPEKDMLNSILFSDNKLLKLFSKWIKPKPVFSSELCVGCQICAENCPVKIITVKNNDPQYDVNKCIGCFCCQELCPKQAVTVKRLPKSVQSTLNTAFLISPIIISNLTFWKKKK